MKIYIGADYRGFELKGRLLMWLAGTDYEVLDKGAYEYAEGDDFNDPAVAVAQAVRSDRGARGILVCGSGDGVCIQANRFRGIRAVTCETTAAAKLAREHDDANILCLPAEFVDFEKAREIVETFLTTEFEPIERRVRRINRLDEREDYA